MGFRTLFEPNSDAVAFGAAKRPSHPLRHPPFFVGSQDPRDTSARDFSISPSYGVRSERDEFAVSASLSASTFTWHWVAASNHRLFGRRSPFNSFTTHRISELIEKSRADVAKRLRFTRIFGIRTRQYTCYIALLARYVTVNISHNSAAVALVSLLIGACGSGDSWSPVTQETEPAVEQVTVPIEQIRSIASEAYIYGFPMVMNYKTLWNYVIDEGNPEYKGPFNEVSCEARLYTPDDKAIVTPNADTPYCIFWMDLRAEPLVLSVPEMEPERYYSFQLIDLYTHNYAYVGTLTTGNEAGRYLLAGSGWTGDIPAGVTDVIRSETDFILNITRTQVFGPDDLAKVAEIQGQYQLQPLSAFLGEEAPAESVRRKHRMPQGRGRSRGI